MEGMIATLVKDFEDGKMDRRQLIQCLALVAMAGPAAAAPQAPAPAAKARTSWSTPGRRWRTRGTIPGAIRAASAYSAPPASTPACSNVCTRWVSPGRA